MKLGRVYFVSAPGRVKIGFTTHPESRLQQLQRMDMETLTVIGSIVGTRKNERDLHAELVPFNIRGEWFVDCDQVRSVINAALTDGFPLEPAEDGDPDRSDISRNHNTIVAARNAIREASEIGDKIRVGVARGEDVSELVRTATFLAEQIIVPLLSGEAH